MCRCVYTHAHLSYYELYKPYLWGMKYNKDNRELPLNVSHFSHGVVVLTLQHNSHTESPTWKHGFSGAESRRCLSA